MLEVVKDVETLSKSHNLDHTVSAMIKQIYDCAIFLKDYADKSFGSKLTSTAIDFRSELNPFTRANASRRICEWDRRWVETVHRLV
jgi:hypothetical protein